MTDPDDPVRLGDEADVPPGLRHALERARADVGTDAEVARLAAKLGPLLAPVGTAAAHAAVGGGSSVTAKLGLSALATLAGVGGAWLLFAPSTPTPEPTATPAASANVVVSPSPALPPSSSPGVMQSPAIPATPSAKSTVEKPAPSTKVISAAPISEAELLEQARAALKAGDSARALQRVSEHAQRYPRGALVQEREVMAIQALRRLGRDADADRRAEAFAKAYPGSAFQRKLQR